MSPQEINVLFAGITIGLFIGAVVTYPLIAAFRYLFNTVFSLFTQTTQEGGETSELRH